MRLIVGKIHERAGGIAYGGEEFIPSLKIGI
jgi:hypothetical protein